MLKKRKIKAIYIVEGVCNNCGGRMVSTGLALSSWPPQYPYQCEECDFTETYFGNDRPGEIIYEFEEDEENV